MGGGVGYLRRMPAIGWIRCHPLTWHGSIDVRWEFISQINL